MLPIHTILHPTDFSDCSDYALRVACMLAGEAGGHLILLHVEPLPTILYGEGVVPPDPDRFHREAWRKLEQIQVPASNVAVVRRLEEGMPAEEILRVAKDENADMIIMGTHGRRGLARLVMGSVAELVVRRANCPVLTVKKPFPALQLTPPAPVEATATA